MIIYPYQRRSKW